MRKVLISFAIVVTAVVPATAQDNIHALSAAVDTVVRKYAVQHAAVTDKIIEDIWQKNKKSKDAAQLAYRIAKAYYNYNKVDPPVFREFHVNDTIRAFKFIYRATHADTTYAPAYVLAADIISWEKRGTPEADDQAMKWLDTGIKQNPKDSSLYLAQAEMLVKTNVDEAVGKLQELKKKDPDFPIDLHLGRMYFKQYTDYGKLPMQEIASYYGKYYSSGKRDLMTRGDLGAYCLGLLWDSSQGEGRFQTLVEVANYGVEKFPEDFALRQSLFYGLWGTSKWKEGIDAYANMVGTAKDSTKIGTIDMLRYAMCLKGAKRYDESIAIYEKIQNSDNASESNKKQAENNIAITISAQVEEHTKMGDYQKAVNTVLPYVEKYRIQGNQNDNLMLAYANIYIDWAQEPDADKQAKLMEADKILLEAIPNSKDNNELFARYRFQRIYLPMDGKASTGAAIESVEKMEQVIMGNGEPTGSSRAAMIMGYRYLIGYYVGTKNDLKKGYGYALKLLELDPTNEGATNVKNLAEKRGIRR